MLYEVYVVDCEPLSDDVNVDVVSHSMMYLLAPETVFQLQFAPIVLVKTSSSAGDLSTGAFSVAFTANVLNKKSTENRIFLFIIVFE